MQNKEKELHRKLRKYLKYNFNYQQFESLKLTFL